MESAHRIEDTAGEPGKGAPIVAVQKPAHRIYIDPADFRAIRILSALNTRPRSRIECDSIAGAANAPDLILRLRSLGLELPCERITVEDRDGCKVHPGVYSASAKDKALIRRALRLPDPSKTAKTGAQAGLQFEGNDGERT